MKNVCVIYQGKARVYNTNQCLKNSSTLKLNSKICDTTHATQDLQKVVDHFASPEMPQHHHQQKR